MWTNSSNCLLGGSADRGHTEAWSFPEALTQSPSLDSLHKLVLAQALDPQVLDPQSVAAYLILLIVFQEAFSDYILT